MKTIMTAVICGALGLPYVVFGQHHPPPTTTTIASDQSISGEWLIHFQAGHQSVSGNLRLQADGDQITGSVETAHTGPGTVQHGKWSKPKLSVTLVFEKHESVALEGELKNDGTLAGHYTTEGRTETWLAERGKTAAVSNGVYAQYERLIGTWDMTAPEGGRRVAVQRFSWGPGHSYIWYASSFIAPDGKEEPHFEGMLVWNGVHKNLDMLLTLDLKSGRAQEQGTFSVAPDGMIVRDVTGVYSEGVTPLGETQVGPDGMTKHFRQTFRADGADKLVTSVMRETNDGSWVATFPGSERLIMVRKK
jgi:hypothetical protein